MVAGLTFEDATEHFVANMPRSGGVGGHTHRSIACDLTPDLRARTLRPWGPRLDARAHSVTLSSPATPSVISGPRKHELVAGARAVVAAMAMVTESFSHTTEFEMNAEEKQVGGMGGDA